MVYAAALTDGVHNLMTMESDPAPVRMRRIIAKLRHVPRPARGGANQHSESAAAVRRARRVDDARRRRHARQGSRPRVRRRSERRAARLAAPRRGRERRRRFDAYVTYLQHDVIPKATGDFAIGADNVARRYRAEELIDTPLPRLVAIGERELARLQSEFRAAANALAPGRDPQADLGAPSAEIIRAPATSSPPPSESSTRSPHSSSAHGIATLPPNERVVVAHAPPFDLGFASMHASPPLEKTPRQERLLYLRRASGLAPARRRGVARAVQLRVARQYRRARSDARALAALDVHATDAGQGATHLDRAESVSAAVVRPGRMGALRRADGARRGIRRHESATAARTVERRAHARVPLALGYQAAHASSGRSTTRSGASSTTRTSPRPPRGAKPSAARTIRPMAAISSARWPSSSCALTTRRSSGAKFTLRDFHERFMTNGIAPIWAHRQLLLPGDTLAVIQ